MGRSPSREWSNSQVAIRSLVVSAAAATLFLFPVRAIGEDMKTPVVQTNFQDLVARLPANVVLNISPPSLKGATVVLYQDPQSHRFFIKPMLLPDWESMTKGIADKCENGKSESTSIVEVQFWLEFGRQTIRQEIASIAAARLNAKDLTESDIFYFPYAWLSVTTGERAQLNDETKRFLPRTIAEYPFGAKDAGTKRALQITEPPRYLAHMYGTCEELKFIRDNRDISGNLYAPTKDTQINAFSVQYGNFVNSNAFKNIVRSEVAAGEQIVTSRANSKGAGLNIKGVFGAGAASSDTELKKVDTRTRTVSANLISDSALAFADTLSVQKWIEFENKDVGASEIEDELTKFVLRNSVPIDVQIKRLDDKNWALTSGAESRSLTAEEMKQVVESSSKLDIEFSDKTTIGCPDSSGTKKDASSTQTAGNPYCGSADKKFKGVDDNGIKWQQDGAAWIPTSMTLYAVSKDKLEQASKASVVEVLAKEGGLIVDKLQPVADETVSGSDLVEIIKKITDEDIKALKQQINESLPTVAQNLAGADIQQVIGGTGTNHWQNCQAGSSVTGIDSYVEDGHIKLVIRCDQQRPKQLK